MKTYTLARLERWQSARYDFRSVVRAVDPAEIGINIGQIFLGKYRVEAILGQGGMGVVAECTHLALNERVAIKMLRKDVLLDQDAVQRFIREAQAAVKLKSEYVARVSDVGTFENGVPYMVMEYLEGHDMGQLLEQRGVLPIAWASDLMMQTCEALAEAHALGIVHRDVKPTNLFVTWRPDGTALVKVLDFGISKSPMGTDMQLTQTQSLLGTPAYMSPEQMRSARLVDARTDIWSLGTVLYEILEGHRPFEAESFSEMCVKVAVDSPSPMVNTPPALQAVILKCLAKTPEQRYPNMAELGRDLIPFTNDQHQSSLLVERMGRMLRRGQHSWDGDSTSSARPREPLRDVSSGATPVPQWQHKSDPAMTPWHAASEPFATAITARADGSSPFVKADVYTEPSTILNAPIVRRRWPLWIGAILLLSGIGVALGFVLSGSVAETSTTIATPTPPTAPAIPANTTGSAAAVVNPAGSAAPQPATSPPTPTTPPTPATTTQIDSKATGSGDKTLDPKQHPPIRHVISTRPKPPPTVHHVVNSATEEPKVPVKESTPPVAPPKPAEKCDPFSAMHRCADK